jgi:REP element-mobilizing transposase RayT
MGQSLAQIYVHLIFSTKGREPVLIDADLRERTHAYLAGICRNQDSPALIIGGTEDHVHALCRLGKQIAISDLVRELKRDSSTWIKTQHGDVSGFHWQAGYGAFSISPGHVVDLKPYIANQIEHHRQESFQDEFRRVCSKYGVEIDERYVWE